MDAILQLQNARRNIIAAVFRSAKPKESLPGPAILESLNATLIGWWEEPRETRVSLHSAYSEVLSRELDTIVLV
jgi:hypothetical protein